MKKTQILKKEVIGKIFFTNIFFGSHYLLDTEEPEWEEKTDQILTTKESELFIFEKNKKYLIFHLKEQKIKEKMNPISYTLNIQSID